MRAHAFGFRQFMAHDVARQINIQWLAPTLEAFVGWHIQRAVVAAAASSNAGVACAAAARAAASLKNMSFCWAPRDSLLAAKNLRSILSNRSLNRSRSRRAKRSSDASFSR